MKITAIILSAGRGTRLNSDIPKQYIEVNGKPLIAYTLEHFQKCRADEIVVVTAPGNEEYMQQDIICRFGFDKVSRVVSGGSERYYSVLNGLRAGRCDYVLIHDGARPFITEHGINMMIDAVIKYDAAVAASPSKDTVKITDAQDYVQLTTERSRTWLIQTPQCFRYDLIMDAYEKVVGAAEEADNADDIQAKQDLTGITDDAMVFETAFPELRIKLVDTGEENTKITTQADLEYMKWILRNR